MTRRCATCARSIQGCRASREARGVHDRAARAALASAEESALDRSTRRTGSMASDRADLLRLAVRGAGVSLADRGLDGRRTIRAAHPGRPTRGGVRRFRATPSPVSASPIPTWGGQVARTRNAARFSAIGLELGDRERPTGIGWPYWGVHRIMAGHPRRRLGDDMGQAGGAGTTAELAACCGTTGLSGLSTRICAGSPTGSCSPTRVRCRRQLVVCPAWTHRRRRGWR